MVSAIQAQPAPPEISFNRDIRPVLSDTCFPCHGFDGANRKASLRLDTIEGQRAVHEGRQAVKPGDLAGSELWRRVTSKDPKQIMPPPESRKELKPHQVERLRQWIALGAPYEEHWAFSPPQRPVPPTVRNTAWPRNEIDRFVLASLESRQLAPAEEAPRETLVRRLTLDLTGLPPTITEVEAFLADPQANAYERLVDRLLGSPRYGEHMARYWLDLARYGDTHGLHLDNERSIWPYRDWVVDAFNRNLPFDQFTILQLAGDLLPNPTREQLIASGYVRCNVSTAEGGAIDEEFQVRYAVDRVEAASTAWMGLTMGCAVCHDHKLDPISQKEFYQVFSIFNNIAEKAMDDNALLPPPSLLLPTPEQETQLHSLTNRLAELHRQMGETVAGLQYRDPASQTNAPAPTPRESVWVDDDFPAMAKPVVEGGDPPNQWISQSEGPVFSGDRSVRRSAKGLHQIYFEKCEQPLTIKPGDKLFAYVYLDSKDLPEAIMLQFHTENWDSRAVWGDPDRITFGMKGTSSRFQAGGLPAAGDWARLEVEVAAVGLRPGAKVTGLAFTQFGGTVYWDKAGVFGLDDPANDPERSLVAWERAERAQADKSTAPANVKEILKKDPAQLSGQDRRALRNYFLGSILADPPAALKETRAGIKQLNEKLEALQKEIPATMIARELDKPRPAWLLVRGQYDKHGEEVGPGVPAILPPLPQAEQTNRLTFARWLVDPAHPLTARVTVNRFWQQLFGVGIVKTAEDFGSKGEWPSHPELLDWLATEFVRSGWDVKQLVRLIVSSATYRQHSRVAAGASGLDPENRLLARGSRFRLDGEVLRDSALSLADLLNLQMGGRGVRPYQPPGIWEAVGYTTSTTAKYTQDHGEALYRRSLYLFWKRTAPPPSMTTFDAPSREQCRARRERTNTPLQAMVTLNDPQYFEAARHLGHRMLRQGGAEPVDRLRYGFRLATARWPDERECAVLAESLATQRAHFEQAPEAAKLVVAVGESSVPDDFPAPELAAYTMVANLLLNMDEVLTRN